MPGAVVPLPPTAARHDSLVLGRQPDSGRTPQVERAETVRHAGRPQLRRHFHEVGIARALNGVGQDQGTVSHGFPAPDLQPACPSVAKMPHAPVGEITLAVHAGCYRGGELEDGTGSKTGNGPAKKIGGPLKLSQKGY